MYIKNSNKNILCLIYISTEKSNFVYVMYVFLYVRDPFRFSLFFTIYVDNFRAFPKN